MQVELRSAVDAKPFLGAVVTLDLPLARALTRGVAFVCGTPPARVVIPVREYVCLVERDGGGEVGQWPLHLVVAAGSAASFAVRAGFPRGAGEGTLAEELPIRSEDAETLLCRAAELLGEAPDAREKASLPASLHEAAAAASSGVIEVAVLRSRRMVALHYSVPDVGLTVPQAERFVFALLEALSLLKDQRGGTG